MTHRDWIAVAGITVTVLIALGGALLAHVRRDERREARLLQVEQEIGTRNEGMRGKIHEHSNALTWLSGCLWMIASKIGIDLPRRDK